MAQKQKVSEEIRDEEFTKAMDYVLREDMTLLERLAEI